MNKGLKMATGDVVGILNSDDFYANNQILSQVAKEFSDPSIDVVFGDLVFVDHGDVNKIVSGDRQPSRLSAFAVKAFQSSNFPIFQSSNLENPKQQSCR